MVRQTRLPKERRGPDHDPPSRESLREFAREWPGLASCTLDLRLHLFQTCRVLENGPPGREVPKPTPDMMFSNIATWTRATAAASLLVVLTETMQAEPTEPNSQEMDQFRELASHEFHPLREGFTYDRHLDRHGVADLNDDGWRVRTLAVRDAVRLGGKGIPPLIESLESENPHVRQVAAMSLGILRATPAVEALAGRLRSDPDETVRSQAAVALGQIGEDEALAILRERAKEDPSADVRHQCEISIYQIEQGISPGDDLAAAYAGLDEEAFRQVETGRRAFDFELEDTQGKKWRLSDFKGEKTVVLIWIFADWCPVCHREFQDLIRLREEFEKEDVQVFTIECHDRFRSRVMAGDEMRPTYWFSQDQSPQESYGASRWWPHLVDLACNIGAAYGVDPLEFVVHSEWINRPATVIVDKEGIVRFAYRGTYWGDRPSIEKTLEMIREESFTFEHPERLQVK